MNRFCMLLSLLVATGVAAQTPDEVRQQLEKIDWLTEDYPPFNYVDPSDNQLKGITVDILMEMFERAGVGLTRSDLKVLPWARSYSQLLNEPGTALFSTTYTIERLQHFKFVGPIVPTRVSLIASKSKGLKIGSVEDMRGLKIGTIRDDIGDQLIRALDLGGDAVQSKHSPSGMMQMLGKGRLDAIAYAEDIAHYQLKLAGLDPDEYEIVYVLQKSHMGYAFHKDTDPRVLEPLRKALDELRADGVVDRIRARYLGGSMDNNQGGVE